MYYTPLQQLKANLDSKRILANAARADANKRLEDAAKLDKEAEDIQAAVTALEDKGFK